jgi:hypothetical protein
MIQEKRGVRICSNKLCLFLIIFKSVKQKTQVPPKQVSFLYPLQDSEMFLYDAERFCINKSNQEKK